MHVYIYSQVMAHLMAIAARPVELSRRLERLTGESSDCCVPEYCALAEKVREQPRFADSLRRAHAMADESRLLILGLLRRRTELCACELQAALGVTHATVSHHMHILDEAGIVTSEKRGKWVYYRLLDREGARLP